MYTPGTILMRVQVECEASVMTSIRADHLLHNGKPQPSSLLFNSGMEEEYDPPQSAGPLVVSGERLSFSNVHVGGLSELRLIMAAKSLPPEAFMFVLAFDPAAHDFRLNQSWERPYGLVVQLVCGENARVLSKCPVPIQSFFGHDHGFPLELRYRLIAESDAYAREE